MSSTPRSESLGRPGASTVYLQVRHDRNRQLLAQRLAEQYEVLEPEDATFHGADADLYVVDAPSLERYLDDVEEKRGDADPAFLPFLLLLGERRDQPPDRVWDVVDDVIATPVSGGELNARVENLVERRELSKELKRQRDRSEERFRSLFEAAPDPVAVTDEHGVITEVNEAFAETLGVPARVAVGATFADLASLVDTVESVTPVPDHDEATKEPIRWQLANGETLVTELNADDVRSVTGDDEWLGVFRDVTELMEREEELERQNERLEEFASTVAHDLKNPLSVVSGFVELAYETGDVERLEKAEAELERMDELIEDVLTLARKGRTVSETEPVPVERVAHRAWEYVDLPDDNLDVDASPTVEADRERLHELFLNLFENAADHGGEDVEVTVDVRDAGDGFYVADDGPGFDPDDADLDSADLFDAGVTTTDDGTGFGLAIVEQVAEGHGWDVAAGESEAGGARFDVTGVDFAG